MNTDKQKLAKYLKSGKAVNKRGIDRQKLVNLKRAARNTYHEKIRKDGSIKRWRYSILEYFTEFGGV